MSTQSPDPLSPVATVYDAMGERPKASAQPVDVLAVMRNAVSVLHGAADEGADTRRYADALHEAYIVIANLIPATRDVLPFVATQAVGCHGDKCRESWCYSCFGDEEADEAAERGRAAYHAAHAALARVQGGAA